MWASDHGLARSYPPANYVGGAFKSKRRVSRVFMERPPDLASPGSLDLLQLVELPGSAEAVLAPRLKLCREAEAATGTSVWVRASEPLCSVLAA